MSIVFTQFIFLQDGCSPEPFEGFTDDDIAQVEINLPKFSSIGQTETTTSESNEKVKSSKFSLLTFAISKR